MSAIYRKSICPLDCPDACGMVVKIEDGRVVSVDGDPEHPYTRGFLCSKVRNHFVKKTNGEGRITRPLLRTGNKGEGLFHEISLAEALDITAEKISSVVEEHGPQSVLPFSYAGNMGQISRAAGDDFFNKMGATKLLRTVCTQAGSDAWERHAGDFPGTDPETAAHSDLIIIWGMNVKVTSPHFIPFVNQARKNGAKLIVIDVYKNATARMADHFLQILPGRDADLALGLSRILIEEKAIDTEFVKFHTTGFEGFSEHTEIKSVDDYALSAGVAASELWKLAGFIKNTKKIFLRMGVGFTRNSRGENSLRAVASLGALLGLYRHDEPGRGILFTTGGFRGENRILTGEHLANKQTRSVNMIRLAEAFHTTEDPIKLLFVYNSNPLAILPERERVMSGLMRDDLFTVVHEQTMTETALYADLIIPATTSLENFDVYRSYGQHYLAVTSPVVEKPLEALSNYDLFRELASRLGYREFDFRESAKDRRNRYIRSMKGNGLKGGTRIAPGRYIKSVLPQRYDLMCRTGSWKFQFAARMRDGESVPYASGRDLREFDDVLLKKEYPFSLITPPHRNVLNSTFSEFYDGPGECMIHPEDASGAGIENGDMVLLSNKRGSVRRIARITDDTSPGVLVAEGVFRGTVENGGLNNITSMELTETAGGSTFHESRVRLEKAV